MHPVVDLHCDLLAYLGHDPQRSLENPELGCSLPYLQEGNVKVQVCAIFTDVVPESPEQALKQAEIFGELPERYSGQLHHASSLASWDQAAEQEGCTIMASIESAAGVCNEDQPLADSVRQLDRIIQSTGPLAYISLTHHKRNRFGGGNYEPGPLTEDGKYLIDALAERWVPICFSHTSDELALSILRYLDARGYELPILASHSNYRRICDEPRNLPDDYAREIARREGVIGLNVLRKFMDPTDVEGLYRHVAYAHDLGIPEAVAFGADYFYTKDMPEESQKAREPFYLPQHADARFYPEILHEIEKRYAPEYAQQVAWDNALRFLNLVVRK